MAATIRLTVFTGPHKGTRFCTSGQNVCLVGRSVECHMRFCGEARDLSISRFHCQLFLDPPLVHIGCDQSTPGIFRENEAPPRRFG
jgi:FHA domain